MKKLNKLLASTILIASSLFMASAYADNGFYIGGSVGNADVSGGTLSNDFKGDDTGYKIFGGFKFTIFAIEGGYVNFGKAESGGDTVETTAFDLFGLVNIGLGPIDLFGKLGVFSWDSDLTTGGNINKDGTDPVYGVGGGLSLGPLSVRAEYEYFDVGGDTLDDIQMISLGVVYFF